jgi:hypothetical protein
MGPYAFLISITYPCPIPCSQTRSLVWISLTRRVKMKLLTKSPYPIVYSLENKTISLKSILVTPKMLLAWLIHGCLNNISSLLEAQTFIFSSVYIAFKSNIGLKFSSYLTRWVRSILEQKFNPFLWNGSDVCSEKTKVSWDLMCLEEGRWVRVKKARGLIRIRLLS